MNRPLRASFCPCLGCILVALALAIPAIAEEVQPTEISGLTRDPQKADVLIEYMVVPVEDLPLPKGYVPSLPGQGPMTLGDPLHGKRLASCMWLIRVTNLGPDPARLTLFWPYGLGATVPNAGGWGLQKDGKLISSDYADAHPVHYLTGKANEKRLARSITPERWKQLVVLWWGPTAKGAEPPKPRQGEVWNPKGNVEIAALWPGCTAWGYIGFAPKPFTPAKGSPRMVAERQARWRREVGMFYEAELRCDLGKDITWAFVDNPKLAEQIIRDDPGTKTTAVAEQHKSNRTR